MLKNLFLLQFPKNAKHLKGLFRRINDTLEISAPACSYGVLTSVNELILNEAGKN